jgi:integrase
VGEQGRLAKGTATEAKSDTEESEEEMSLTKRGGVYWFDLKFLGERYQRSTHQGDRKVARQIEAAFRTALAKGEVDILEKKAAPALKDFAQRFMDAIQVRCGSKPRTVSFYAEKLSRLLEFEPFANARLNKIDEALIEGYVQQRSKQVAPATVNRELATLRRLLRLAQEWRVIDRVPRIRLLPGERIREFVLEQPQERLYLEMSPDPLKDVALVILDTGLRPGEALALECRDVHLEPVNGARFGYIHVRGAEVGAGKSKSAKRNVSMTPRVKSMLQSRLAGSSSLWVFPSETGKPYLVTSLDHIHATVRRTLRLPKDFVIHSLRHTYGTRLGEAGANAFDIKRLMGHSSVTVSERYVHPTPDALERAVERLDALNQKAAGNRSEGAEIGLLPTVITTVLNIPPVNH